MSQNYLILELIWVIWQVVIHIIFSNNTADLESYLFGIGTSNLVTPFQKPAPNLNNLDNENLRQTRILYA